MKHVNPILIIGVTPNKNIERREIFYDEWNPNYGTLITFKKWQKLYLRLCKPRTKHVRNAFERNKQIEDQILNEDQEKKQYIDQIEIPDNFA